MKYFILLLFAFIHAEVHLDQESHRGKRNKMIQEINDLIRRNSVLVSTFLSY